MLLLLALPSAQAEWRYQTAEKMGTLITVQFWEPDATRSARLMRSSMAEFDRIENAMSTYIPETEISQVNAHAAERPVTVSAELLLLVQRALELSEFTGGYFDITYDSVGVDYDYREKQRPSDADITASLSRVNYRYVELDADKSTIRFAEPGVRINLGGIAKGYSVERVVALLAGQGIEHASVTAGGDTRILGDRRGKPWIVGIRHPDNETAVVTRLPVINEAISTSGDYERFFIEDGKRYHHILNPASGKPTEGVRSVTVLGPDGTLTDGLSTSLFVAGVSEGMRLIDALPAYEAVIIDAAGTLHYSNGLRAE